MFGRLKQKVKEKTGRAKATSLPEDVEAAVTFFKGLSPRVRELSKALNDLNDVFKWQKKANFLAPLSNLGRVGDKVKVSAFEEAVNARIAAEDESCRGINPEIEKFKAYLQSECRVQQEIVSHVNKTRLDMDAANGNFGSSETEGNKMRAESMTREFEAACARIREVANGIKDIEANHTAWLETLAKEMKTTFRA